VRLCVVGSNLYPLRVPDKVIPDIQRHANLGIDNMYYIKTASEQVTSAMEKLEKNAAGFLIY